MTKKFVYIIYCSCLILVNIKTYASDITYIDMLIAQTEKQYSIPNGLLDAIAKVESEKNSSALNIKGKRIFTNNKDDAYEYIENARNLGVSSIDIGVMQVNYRWHSKAFESIEDMLNPKKNIDYAASFLLKLKKQYGTWYKAIQYYHSPDPWHQYQYSRKVIREWSKKYV